MAAENERQPTSEELMALGADSLPPLEPKPPEPPFPLHTRLRRWLRWLWDMYGPDREFLDSVSDRDAERNRAMRIPDGESVIYHCLWLTEFYTPSEAEEMLRRLETMRASMRQAMGRDFAKFVRDMRERTHGGGWHSIGYLVPRGGRTGYGGPDRLITDLPKGVTHAPATVINLTPSLTALVIQFVFDDSVTEEWLAPLHQFHRTRRVIDKGVIRYPGPGQDKPDATAAARAAIRGRCAEWIARHVPGYFSHLSGSDNHPAVEFVTLRRGTPLGEVGEPDDYLWVLGLNESFETWLVNDHLRLRQGSRPFDDDRPHIAVMGAREDELHAHGGWRDTGHQWGRQGVLIGFHEFDRFAAKLALGTLVASYESALARTRDRLVSGRADPDATLKVLQQQLSGLSRGIQSIGPELVRLLNAKWFRRDLPDIKWQMEMPQGVPDPVTAWIDNLRERAERLATSERSARELLVASAQVGAAKEGLRLQRGARIISMVALGVALLSLAANRDAVVSAPLQFLDWLR